MLDKYYAKPTRLRQLRRGPLGSHLDEFAAEPDRQGFELSTGKHRLSLCAKLSAFARVERQQAGGASGSRRTAGGRRHRP